MLDGGSGALHANARLDSAPESGRVVRFGERIILRLRVEVEAPAKKKSRNTAVEGGSEGLGNVLCPHGMHFSHFEAEELKGFFGAKVDDAAGWQPEREARQDPADVNADEHIVLPRLEKSL